MTTIRVLEPQFDNKGNPSWVTRLSAPDDSYAAINKIPDRIIPVIFVPGVMGTNLTGQGKSKGLDWLLDSEISMSAWLFRGPTIRKRHLTPSTMRVLDTGMMAEGTPIPAEELKRRGWGEVSFMSYGKTLPWLEHALNDFQAPETGERAALRKSVLNALVGEAPLTDDEYELSYRYRFPVYACGYNWLDSNAVASLRLSQCIDAVIQRYRKAKQRCEKVIIVTHSMGGLVARHCSEVRGCRDKIFGIVHGVMPATGAAAVYRRFKAGTEGDYVASEVLGNDAAEMTAVLSSAPGPLQLLPSAEYGNGWLKIKDGAYEHSLPKNGDPYGEIYTVRGKWWSMCEDQLINPLNIETNQKKKQTQIDSDWSTFVDIIKEDVRRFHESIRGRYHPNTYAFSGIDPMSPAYGTVAWRGGDLFGNARPTDVMNRPALTSEVLARQNMPAPEIKGARTVKGQFTDGGWFSRFERTYFISEPDEPGDGTVPQRSGRAVRQTSRSYAEMRVGHEPAYQFQKGGEYERACRFTLRAIVKIAQEAQKTSLRYD